MHIELPASLTAEYVSTEWDDEKAGEYGHVVLRFGRADVAEIPVTELQHEMLMNIGIVDWESSRSMEIELIVAAWLREQWGL